MDFIARLRPQQKFDTESQLIAQIAKDCQKAQKILSEAKNKRPLF